MPPPPLSSRGAAALFLLITLSSCRDTPGPSTQDADPARLPDHLRNNPIVAVSEEEPPVPPFERIETRHLLPALEWALARSESDLRRAVTNPAAPDFDNTITPLLRADARVGAVARLAFGLDAVGAFDGAGDRLAGFDRRLAGYRSRVYADGDLHARIDQVEVRPAESQPSSERQRLVDEIRRRFRQSGAHLDSKARKALGDIDRRLAALNAEYQERLLAATHAGELLISKPERLRTLPEPLVAEARQNAADRGHAAGWAFTLHAHSFYPFMRHFPERQARRALYEQRMRRYRDLRRSDADLGRMIERLADLRARRAALLGFESHFDTMLDEASLGGRAELERLLDRLERTARDAAGEELDRLEALARRDGVDGPLQPWDWWYYRQRLEERAPRPAARTTATLTYPAIRSGLFELAGRLWGLEFSPRPDLPRWHQSVEAFAVRRATGEPLGLLFLDPFHRRGKRGGAWMSRFDAARATARAGRPIVSMVTNLSEDDRAGRGGLSVEDVRALFHEFGHALHALLSTTEYAALAGTNVAPDFVEFPALVFERLAFEPELADAYARPGSDSNKLDPSTLRSLAGRGRPTPALELLETLAAVRLDLALHDTAAGRVPSLESAERAVREDLQLPDIVSARHHGGGLDSLFAERRRGGDFRSLWSELLAADAVERLRRGGLSGPVAESLREEIFERGNSRPPLESWQAFAGAAPDAEPLLRSLGLAPHQTAEKMPSGE